MAPPTISGAAPESTPRAPRVDMPRATGDLREPAGEQHDRGAEHPGQHRDEAGLLLEKPRALTMKDVNQVSSGSRQRPIGQPKVAAQQPTKVREVRSWKLGEESWLRSPRPWCPPAALLAEQEPGHDPHQADDAERAECDSARSD